MRLLIFILISWFTSLSIYGENKTVVNVKFQNAKNELVYVYAPINNRFCFATDTIHQIKNDSVYQYNLNISKTSFLNIYIENRGVTIILLSPGDQSTLVYDFNQKSPYSFTGSNAPGQLLLNEWRGQANPYQYEWINDYTKVPLDTIPKKMEVNFRKIEKRDIARFDSLYSLKKISKSFHEFVATDIRLFYLSTLSRIARNAAGDTSIEAYYPYWSQLYKQYPVKDMETGSTWFNYYSNLYIENYLPTQKKRQGITENRPTDQKEYYQQIYRLYKDWSQDKNLQEITLGYKLFDLAINNKTNSTDLIPFFDSFKKEFSKSALCPVFDRFSQQLLLMEEKIKKDFPPGVSFMDKREEMKTLKDITDRFKGKPVFIDFWFSTCGPCKDEFQYAKPLEEFLKKNQIELLYISIDQDRMETNWKNSIKIFDLLGWHIRVPRDVQVDMDKNHGIYLYPNYMLIDKEGNILLKKAKKPSEKEELYQQISKALKIDSSTAPSDK